MRLKNKLKIVWVHIIVRLTTLTSYQNFDHCAKYDDTIIMSDIFLKTKCFDPTQIIAGNQNS